MATKILTAHDLATGDVLSSEITNVGDLVVHAQVTGATNGNKVEYTVVAKEGGNDYVPVTRGYNEAIQFSTYGNMGTRLKIAGIDSESVKIQVKTIAGTTGLLTIESLKTDKSAL